MYRVMCNGKTLYDTRADDRTLTSPRVTLEDNDAGTFEFTIDVKHPEYNLFTQDPTLVVEVFQGDEILFKGRVIEEINDFHKRKNILCEGELAYLKDSIQPQAEYHDLTVRQYLETLINIHNSKVEKEKQFTIGIVTVTDPNDKLYKFSNYESTLDVIRTDLLDTYGGHLRIRYDKGVRYLDYLEDYPNTSNQVIEFGKNLLDFTKNYDLTDICTVVIPLGSKLEEPGDVGKLEHYVDIKSVNNGKDYIVNEKATKEFGWIEKIVHYDNVGVPANLKRKGLEFLNSKQFANLYLEIKAIDLSILNVDSDKIRLLDMVRVLSPVHGLDKFFPVSKLTIQLDSPAQNTFSLGEDVKASMTSQNSGVAKDIQASIKTLPNDLLQGAKDNADLLIKNALNGHVVTRPDEQLIMDTDDIETANKVWRWNINGLGYSNTGYNGTYGTALTMDGHFNGAFIAAGTVAAEHIDVRVKEKLSRAITNSGELAEENAKGYTDENLKNYWTSKEVETAITNTADAITLSAKQTAEAYVDSQLENYVTTSSFKVETDNITSEVNKKVGSSEIISSINQSAESVTIEASKIKFEGLVTANKNFQILDDGSIVTKNGTFTGNITGSKITGSTINITDYNGCSIDLNAAGLRISANKYTDIFGHQGGILTIGTTASVMESMFSPITFQPASGGIWNMPLADGCNKFKFVWNVQSSSYVEIQTLFGSFGLTAWSSDKRLKKNIIDSEISGIDELMKIPHYSFDWKDKDYHVDCGYIAQEMEKLNQSYVVKVSQYDEKGQYTGERYQIDETAIIPIITKALQEVIGRVERLEEK